ncbi:uncharacterized protein PHALS_05105 [Plasmopara halstedii]|uniref:Uncharacterized protein n=1 Tax=Plasmopara halstedii TaxID=4781 RepID=A0A0P1B198_PLAHL|nr:uncharacterized protein PHALS_05105 [Plasmopara halstedii]CEG47769.1 hypothetical protein PHALS_05105 [Plasmopara halstedii]|eukprot:XP_024584138.1 hypothetical protein PHALS_05105 [Plasmopara halstedii]
MCPVTSIDAIDDEPGIATVEIWVISGVYAANATAFVGFGGCSLTEETEWSEIDPIEVLLRRLSKEINSGSDPFEQADL